MTLHLDVSSLARWTGPPVGIARVEHALAGAARRRPDTALCIWDRAEGVFRALRPEWQEFVLGWRGALDVPAPHPSPLSRQRLFAALERIRLTLPAMAGAAAVLQDALLSVRRHGHRVRDPAGQRIAHVPPDLALGAASGLGPGDVLFSAGSDWFHLDADALGAAKRRLGFRYACLCYDLIPVTHPHFYAPDDVALVSRHWRATVPIADLIIANARCIAADLARFAAAERLPLPATAVLPLGCDPPGAATDPLPAGLEPGRYVLFVSTIEPRKGHAMLLRVWRRLRARGIPQAHRFKLVFVGRPGWMVDGVLDELGSGHGLERTVLHLPGVSDATLGALYAQAAFAVYPSQYEGFGLPVIEAFARRTPVLAADAGALPETVGGAFPCLRPDDERAWEETIAAWIERPPAPATPPRYRTWDQAAAALLDRAAAA